MKLGFEPWGFTSDLFLFRILLQIFDQLDLVLHHLFQFHTISCRRSTSHFLKRDSKFSSPDAASTVVPSLHPPLLNAVAWLHAGRTN